MTASTEGLKLKTCLIEIFSVPTIYQFRNYLFVTSPRQKNMLKVSSRNI